MLSVLIGSCLLAVVALIVAERFDSEAGKRVAKPLASVLFIAVAAAAGGGEHAYGRAILVGLVLSFLGDILLLPSGAGTAFRLGTAAFLLGHVAYTVAFVVHGLDLSSTVVAAALVVVPGIVILQRLDPRVPDGMRTLVRAYIAVISIMLTLAIGTFVAAGDVRIVVGAAMFYVSDLSVARDRFVEQSFSNRLWGLPLYYGGQLLLAVSVGQP